MIREAIDKVVSGGSLDMGEAASVMGEIMEGEATPAQIASFITALRIKGETVDEITGMAATMRQKSLKVTTDGLLVDTAGTGGKPATLSTGAVVRVPLFVQEGEIVKVDTRTGDYVGRIKN